MSARWLKRTQSRSRWDGRHGRTCNLCLQVLAKFAQHSLTQKIGIEFAGFCKLDNSFGNFFIDKIALFAKLKSCASHFECGAHGPLGLSIEVGTVKKLRDGHGPSPLLAMELYADRVSVG